MEFSLLKEWQKQLIIQELDSATQGLTEIVYFYERLETAKEIPPTQGEVNYQNKNIKKSSKYHQSSKLMHSKGSNQATKPSEEDEKIKQK